MRADDETYVHWLIPACCSLRVLETTASHGQGHTIGNQLTHGIILLDLFLTPHPHVYIFVYMINLAGRR